MSGYVYVTEDDRAPFKEMWQTPWILWTRCKGTTLLPIPSMHETRAEARAAARAYRDTHNTRIERG